VRAVRVISHPSRAMVESRDATVARARELDLFGWVRADEGGALLVHAEGSEDSVEGLIGSLRDGAAGDVEIEEVSPEGHEQFAVRGVSAGRFEVVEAGHGFEMRLELSGAVRAWALAKHPSMDPAVKRMAFEAGDGGVKGTGPVWDEGTYEQGGRVPWPEAIDRGHAVFVLHGGRLTGGFALQRTRPEPKPQWLLIKRRDEHARPGG
jgi:acylphosphatase